MRPNPLGRGGTLALRPQVGGVLDERRAELQADTAAEARNRYFC
jgi:hypothetical protein